MVFSMLNYQRVILAAADICNGLHGLNPLKGPLGAGNQIRQGVLSSTCPHVLKNCWVSWKPWWMYREFPIGTIVFWVCWKNGISLTGKLPWKKFATSTKEITMFNSYVKLPYIYIYLITHDIYPLVIEQFANWNIIMFDR